jgi:hypothetical protein
MRIIRYQNDEGITTYGWMLEDKSAKCREHLRRVPPP